MKGSQPRCDLLIVLTSLAAEGCPQLALQLAQHWQQQGLVVVVLALQDHPNDLRPEFEALCIPIHIVELGDGLTRYPRLAWASYRLCLRLRPRLCSLFPSAGMPSSPGSKTGGCEAYLRPCGQSAAGVDRHGLCQVQAAGAARPARHSSPSLLLRVHPHSHDP